MTVLSAGFARADITPQQPTRLSGYASRLGLSSGTLDPLEVRVLLFGDDDERRIALVAIDLIGVPYGFEETLAAMLGEDGPALIVTATHTHAGPPVLARAMLGAPPEGYIDMVLRRTAEAIAVAAGQLAPVRVSHRRIAAPGIAHNRRDPDGPVDHNADVVALHRADGQYAAFWVTFACHPVVLGPENLCYSADFPGVTRRRVEAALGAPVLYTTGCAGEINLGHSALDSIRRIGMDRRTPDEATRIGERLAQAIIAGMGSPVAPANHDCPLRQGTAVVTASYAPPDDAMRSRLAAAAEAVLANAKASAGDHLMAEIDRAWLARPRYRQVGERLKVSALRLGPAEAVFLPGEIFVETALAARYQRPGLIAAGYAHANPGYIPPASARGGYEVDVAWRPYGAPGPFAPGTAEVLMKAATDLLSGIRNG